jgi:hypothetical protein
VHALEGVSFDMREGEMVCVFGLSLGLEQGMKLVSALEMGAFDAFVRSTPTLKWPTL